MDNLKYTEILALNKRIAGTITSKPYNIGILSNVTINSFKEILEFNCRVNQIEPVVELGNFDNIVQDSASFQSKDLVIIFYDMLNIVDSVSKYFEDLEGEKLEGLKSKLFNEIDIIFENLKGTPSVIINSFSSSYYGYSGIYPLRIESLVDELNNYVNENKTKNVTVVDIDKIFFQLGLGNAIDFRFYHSSKAPYTIAFFKSYVSLIENVLLRNTGKLKKAIIFDCDNTLWKGIVGEDGVDLIDMSPYSKSGKFFYMVQQIAVYLSKKGVIVGLCSKNNEADVQEVLHMHADMVLKDEFIVIRKVNWEDKSSNLRAIAAELNIGLDSLVFVDDSSFEINLIKEQIPEIHTIQVPADLSTYPSVVLKSVYKYFNLLLNSEDERKTEMYKQQFQRQHAKESFSSIDDYLASLEIALNIGIDSREVIPRIAQLTQKTNQFNLTTKRYSEAQVENFMDGENHHIYSLSVKDKFGDNGLTGVCILSEDEAESGSIVIDTFLMSCRIIGRNIEYAFMNFILSDVIHRGYRTVKATYIPTPKNSQVEGFYEKVGFHLVMNNGGTKEYLMTTDEFEPKKVDYIKLENELVK